MNTFPRLWRTDWRRLTQLILCLLALGAPVGSAFAAGGDVDPSFDPGTGPNFAIYELGVELDGKILIGGAFTTYAGVSRPHIARVNSDGTLDTSFNPGTGTDAAVLSIAFQTTGLPLIGGSFTTYNGTTANRIARLLDNGQLDTSFKAGTGADGAIRSVAVDRYGGILVGGDFNSFNGDTQTAHHLTRLLVDGQYDFGFNPGSGVNGPVYCVVPQSDGTILIGGSFSGYNGGFPSSTRILRLHENGSLDNTFNPTGSGANNIVRRIVPAGGRIIIAGDFTAYNGTARNHVARIYSDGSLDTSFNPGSGANNSVFDVVVQPDLKVILTGSFTSYNGVAAKGVVRLNPDGSVDTTFTTGSGADTAPDALGLQPDGKVVVGGGFTTFNGAKRNYLARLLPASGSISFVSASNSVKEEAGTATVALTRVGGADNEVTAEVFIHNNTTDSADYVFAPGALDNSFQPPPPDKPVYAIVKEATGSALIGGAFNNYGNHIGRIKVDGTQDTSFNAGGSGPDGSVYSIAVQPDTKIVIGGAFTHYNGVPVARIARINPYGTLDGSFDPGAGAKATVNSVALQADGKILIGGAFTTYNGKTANHITRLYEDGSAEVFFSGNTGTGADGDVNKIVVQPDGEILIGGAFTSYNNLPQGHLARLTPFGRPSAFFPAGTGFDGDVVAIALRPSGTMVIGGNFTHYNGAPANYIAQLAADGTRDPNFTNNAFDARVISLALQANGKVLVGGLFTHCNGVLRNYFARLSVNGSLDTAFNPNNGPNSPVNAIALDGTGRVTIGGGFTTYNGVTRSALARVNGDMLVTWPAGVAGAKGVLLPIVDDTLVEGDETLTFTLVVYTGGAGASPITSQTLTIIDNDAPVAGPTPDAHLANISTRLPVQTGDNVLIAGFIVQGQGTKKVIIRGIGPSLPVAGALSDPTLELHDQAGNVIGFNDNWQDNANASEISGTGIAPKDPRESALLISLASGTSYTAVVRGASNTTGVGLVEVYDLDTKASAGLVNLSTRGFVETGDNVMIGGFINTGGDPAKLLLRAIGPSLATAGVSEVLNDPFLELHNGNGDIIFTNNNWRDTQQEDIQALGLAPKDDRESAILITLTGGSYTAIVKGADGGMGNGLIELYKLGTPLGVNLIVNPDAEDSEGTVYFTDSKPPAGWTVTGAFTALSYDACCDPGNVTPAYSQTINGGKNLFAGGPVTEDTSATQVIDFHDLGPQVDAGSLNAVLDGLFGGYLSETDYMTMTATFIDYNGANMSVASIGEVSPADRGNQTQMLERGGTVPVPPGARAVRITLTSHYGSGSYCNGYADNLSFKLVTK